MMFTAPSVLHSSSLTMVVTGVMTFIACGIITAPYGRYSSEKGWGFLVPAKLSWLLMESPNLWLPPMIYAFLGSSDCLRSRSNRILFGMFFIHYIHRSVIYPLFRVSGTYHQPIPVSVMLLAFSYCAWNSMTQALALLVVTVYPDEWLSDPRFLLGFTVFCLGLTTNIVSDSTLLGLKCKKRQNSTSIPGDTSIGMKSYVIPRGGLFEYISCANYLILVDFANLTPYIQVGEIVEWVGFAIACWSLPAFAFAMYTFCNLGPRARTHHAWYKSTFKDYPKERKAVIPFLW